MLAANRQWGVEFNDVAVTFINNDYGKGLSDSFINAYKGLGGKVSAVVPHEDRQS